MVPNSNSDHQGTIDFLQEKIVKYFGSRNASADPMYPLVLITCEVTEDDITYIKDKVSDTIHFSVIIGKEGSDKVQGDFIHLD
jgi:hypothetical protein